MCPDGSVYLTNRMYARIDRAAKRKAARQEQETRTEKSMKIDGARSVETPELKRAFKSSAQLVSPVKRFYIPLFYGE